MMRRSLALTLALAAVSPDAVHAFAPSSLRAFGAAKAALPTVRNSGHGGRLRSRGKECSIDSGSSGTVGLEARGKECSIDGMYDDDA